MRRKDREVTDFDKIIRMIDACDIIRLGLADGDFPYIVPVNFAYTVNGQEVCFYIHGAMAGRKYELLTQNPCCSFEMDLPLEMDCIAEKKDVTMRYKSVMGKARVQFLEGEEKQQAIDSVIMARYAKTRNFTYNKAAVQRTAVGKLTVIEMTAKENPVRGGYRELRTERLVLRRWKETDAESLYEYAKDPEVGPIAGWPPHKNAAESLEVIRTVFNGAECYAICESGSDKAIGAIELMRNGHTDMTERDDECELGYWLGRPFWGRGYMTEAARALIRHGFEDLHMSTIWCGYYDGNHKSKRVQEKLGFRYHHTCEEVPVPLMKETRICHTNYLTKEQWMEQM